MIQQTLVLLVRRQTNEILLAMKKRGFGAGKLNGVGGKVKEGETAVAAAVREIQEEVGVVVGESDLAQVAEIIFHFTDDSFKDIFCRVYSNERWLGEPQESEEMAPEWFDMNNIPYDRMWVDDKYWLPAVLRGDVLKATFNFSKAGAGIASYKIEGTSAL
jgi:8-oxo-dGTP diphosphatase